MNEKKDDRENLNKDGKFISRYFSSEITIEEIENTKDGNLRKSLKGLVKDFEILKKNEAIVDLADSYIKNNIFPEKYNEDALHVAIASFHYVSYIISWNFEHLVKVKTRRWVNSVNILEGFNEIEIISPQEL